ncbi:MAG: restriction endonuclease subunit S [Gemmatimonadaceae bacterium]|nr:restriction endonuclease subunit S [Gemmatimonadaceae bacterium]
MTDFRAAPNFWLRKQLKWAVTFQRGHDLPDDAREEGPVPIYAGGGITGWHTESCASPPGIVTGRYGTIGEFHLVSTPYWPLNTALYSTDLHGNDAEYLRYLLDFLAPLFQVHAGKSAVPGVDRNDIHTLPVALPGWDQQRRIAAFLGGETRRIDGLLAAKRCVLDLLAEKRKAIIATAVTRGLDPKVKLRDSGVPWLGEIPAHWGVVQSRRLFRVRNEPARPSDRQLTASQKYGMLPQSDFVELEGRRVVELEKGVDSLRHVEPNDFVISLRSFQGGLEWSKISGSVTFHYVVLVPIKWVHPPFFAHLFKSLPFIEALRSTATLIRDGQDLRFSHFTLVDLPIVPIDEQRKIAAHVDRETAKLDAVRAATERTIALLKERRSALIAAAVTGQLDITVAA